MKVEDFVGMIEDFKSEQADPETVVHAALVVTVKTYDGELLMRVYGRGDIEAMHATFKELGQVSTAALAQKTQH